MGKILDYIVKKGEGNYFCYKTNKVSLNISDTDVLDYDDKPASTRNKSRIVTRLTIWLLARRFSLCLLVR